MTLPLPQRILACAGGLTRGGYGLTRRPSLFEMSTLAAANFRRDA